MAERYKQLFRLETYLYLSGAPLIILAGALLKDTLNNSVLAQIKFLSIDTKPIKAVKVFVQPLSVSGERLGKEVEHQYLDVFINRDEAFGQKEPINLPDNNTRQFSIRVSEVVFDDNSSWNSNGMPWSSIHAPQSLSDAFNNDNELVKQFKHMYGKNSAVLPEANGDLWFCTCGSINTLNENQCHACGKDKNSLLRIDFDQLETDKTIRLKDEAYAKACHLMEIGSVDSLKEGRKIFSKISDWKDAEYKIEEIEERLKERIRLDKIERVKKIRAAKRKRDSAIVICCIVAVAIVLIAVITTRIIPNIKYKEAVSLMEAGEYETASKRFEAIKNFKDSEALIKECSYRRRFDRAEKLFEEGEYYKCYSELLYMGEREDANKLLDTIQSMKPVFLLDEKSTFVFGEYEQDNVNTNGAEPLEWIVLDHNPNGNKLVIISKYVLDCQPFNTEKTDVTWETSSIRSWLNSSFYEAAFSDDEKNHILATHVTAHKNPFYGTDAGASTVDRVFYLSVFEAKNYFISGDYYDKNEHRKLKCLATPYALSQGVEADENGFAPWALRTPGSKLIAYTGVARSSGAIIGLGDTISLQEGWYVNTPGMGVRPVICIDGDYCVNEG